MQSPFHAGVPRTEGDVFVGDGCWKDLDIFAELGRDLAKVGEGLGWREGVFETVAHDSFAGAGAGTGADADSLK